VRILGAADLEAYLGELRRRRLSRSLVERAGRVLPSLFSHLSENAVRDLRAVSEAHLVSWSRALAQKKTRQGGPLSLTTQVLYLAAVRRFFAWMVKRRRILVDPAKGLVMTAPDSLPRLVLTEAQARRLMSAPGPVNPRWWAGAVERRNRALVETLYATGLRLSEIARLEVADLDLLEGTLLVRNGKGQRDRMVPVTGRAAVALDEYVRDARPLIARDHRQQALFLAWTGARLSPVTIGVIVRAKGEAAGIRQRISPHVLRHTCATHLLRGGADVRHVQELLGHRSIDSTVRYTRVAIRDLVAMIERAHPRERAWRRRRG
jgi:integrase/recombinase XerD